jgi:hypothetical protein
MYYFEGLMEDCFFYIKGEDPDAIIECLCVDCRESKFSKLGWFWEGSQKGYGPFKFACESCNKVIYNPPELEEED